MSDHGGHHESAPASHGGGPSAEGVGSGVGAALLLALIISAL